MFLSARHKPMAKEAMTCQLVDMNSGEKIPRVVWANDETGRYRQVLQPDENGNMVEEYKNKRGKISFRVRSRVFTGNIKIVKKDDA